MQERTCRLQTPATYPSLEEVGVAKSARHTIPTNSTHTTPHTNQRAKSDWQRSERHECDGTQARYCAVRAGAPPPPAHIHTPTRRRRGRAHLGWQETNESELKSTTKRHRGNKKRVTAHFPNRDSCLFQETGFCGKFFQISADVRTCEKNIETRERGER